MVAVAMNEGGAVGVLCCILVGLKASSQRVEPQCSHE
jgi:hypothetical protein